MSFPDTHPLWMWLYFGAMGSIGAILFTLIIWNWMKLSSLEMGFRKTAANWNIVGYMFLFVALWFMCGVVGTPGNMLSPDTANQKLEIATGSAVTSMLLSILGWVCLLVSQRKVLNALTTEQHD